MFHSPYSLSCPRTDLEVNRSTNLSISLAQTRAFFQVVLGYHLWFLYACLNLWVLALLLESSTSFLRGGGPCAAHLHITQRI